MKACLNGARRPGEHPDLPLTAEELGQAAAATVAAGAEAVHVHPRGRDLAESLAASDVGAAVAAIRAAAPGVPVGVSTGIWMVHGNAEVRRRAVLAWAELPSGSRPDFTSVNVGEPGFEELADALEGADIDVEAGVWSLEDADELGRRPVRRVLVEILTGPASTAVERANEVLHRLDEAGSTAPRLLHGEGEACWPLVSHAGRLGLPTRMGLEDTLVDERGAPALSNADLVTRALRAWLDARGDAG